MEPIDEDQRVGGGEVVECPSQDARIFPLHHMAGLQINAILVNNNGCNIKEVAPSISV
jgi:hypothetical protein